MAREIRLAIVGADTLAGEAVLEALGEAHAPIAGLTALAAEVTEEAEASVSYRRRPLGLTALGEADFRGQDLVLFVGDPGLVLAYGDAAGAAGAVVLDLSGAPLTETGATLLVPEIAALRAAAAPGARLATLAPEGLLLWPLLQALETQFGLQALDLLLLYPASSVGRAGVDTLARETVRLLNGQPVEPGLHPVQAAFNLLPDWSPSSPVTAGLLSGLRRLLAPEVPEIQLDSALLPVFHGLSCRLRLHCRRMPTVGDLEACLDALPALDRVAAPGVGLLAASQAGRARVVTRLRGDDLVLWLLGDPLRQALAPAAVTAVEAVARARDA